MTVGTSSTLTATSDCVGMLYINMSVEGNDLDNQVFARAYINTTPVPEGTTRISARDARNEDMSIGMGIAIPVVLSTGDVVSVYMYDSDNGGSPVLNEYTISFFGSVI